MHVEKQDTQAGCRGEALGKIYLISSQGFVCGQLASRRTGSGQQHNQPHLCIHQRERYGKPWREVWKYLPSATECPKSSAQVWAGPFVYNQPGRNNILPLNKEGALQCSSTLSEFFYLWHGRSTNRKGKICRVKSVGLSLLSFELAFTNISGITPSSQRISGKENQCLKSSYTLICACFYKRLVLDNPVGVIYALPNYAVNRLVHFLFCFFLNKA